ncbi:MAG TPA: VOC family protein [Gammaproteobacteria bacterium]|nr:VOC family protein [Gammaproteobacteria bacterium]HRP86155.1 VOC family protein [Gammaproteobacteria bacterium]
MLIQPYLFFDGRCEEAVAFYQAALGARLEMLMRYRDSPDPLPPGMVPPERIDQVMHASLRIGDAVLMASDDCSGNARHFGGFSLSLSVPDAATADRVFSALADGGQVVMPLGKTFWSPRFGMVTDRFGVGWMVSQES